MNMTGADPRIADVLADTMHLLPGTHATNGSWAQIGIFVGK